MLDILSRPNVLILRGVSGAGKDTVCRELLDRLPWGYAHKVSFATQLRRDTELVMPVPMDFDGLADRDTWERESGFKHKMIEVANIELIKDPFRYLRATLEVIHNMPPCLLIVTDCRSENEYDALLRTCNVWVVRIRRPENPYPVMAFDLNLEEYPHHRTFTNLEKNNDWTNLVADVAQLLRTKPYSK